MKLSILLVDDDEIDVMGVKRALSDAPSIVSLGVARDGREALACLRGEPPFHTDASLVPTVILLDLNMPGMSGHEFLRELRRTVDTRCVPVVILSSSTKEWDIEQSYALGAAGYFEKPPSANDYGEILDRIVDYWSRCEVPIG